MTINGLYKCFQVSLSITLLTMSVLNNAYENIEFENIKLLKKIKNFSINTVLLTTSTYLFIKLLVNE